MQTGSDRSWTEINLTNLVHNIHAIRTLVGPKTKIMAVVKANAYGHGSIKISRVLLENGADRLAVACIDEALRLRRSGIDCPIQVLSRTCPDRAEEAVDHHLIQTVYDMELASGLSRAACKKNKKAVIHLKFDTGMGRMGLDSKEAGLKKAVLISAMPGLEAEGVMTHFASADDKEPDYTLGQFDIFMRVCNRLEGMGVHIPVRHAANSAAAINYPQMHLDMVRPGIALYGLYTGAVKTGLSVGFKPVMALKARIIDIKQLNEGAYVGYGRTFKTPGKSRIAVISAGYADGYPRSLSNNGVVSIDGKLAPVVGTVCMDHLMADITNIRCETYIGQEVTLFGGEENKQLEIGKIAERIGTISHELPCGIGMRVPRVYLG